jgi:hypothetical protein
MNFIAADQAGPLQFYGKVESNGIRLFRPGLSPGGKPIRPQSVTYVSGMDLSRDYVVEVIARLRSWPKPEPTRPLRGPGF